LALVGELVRPLPQLLFEERLLPLLLQDLALEVVDFLQVLVAHFPQFLSRDGQSATSLELLRLGSTGHGLTFV
jgi:hypothetical protein